MLEYLNVLEKNGLHPTAKAVGIRPKFFIIKVIHYDV